MLLHIDDNTTIADVQDDFSDSYPLLKIEFYEKPHQYRGASQECHRLSPELKLGAIRRKHDPGNLEIYSWFTTGRVERDFENKFGLHVQVFRQEAGAWVQSGSTDGYTLAEQMERARNTALRQPKRKKTYVEYEYL
jgi:hypothetical protein